MKTLKAIAYIAVILAALAMGYRAIFPIPPPAPYISELQKMQDEQIRAYRSRTGE